MTCFLALQHPDSVVTGLELSQNAVFVAEELARILQVDNVHFTSAEMPMQGKCDTLFSCRTVHENIVGRALCKESGVVGLPVEEQVKRYEKYAKELAALVNTRGYLVSVERYEDESAYAALVHALEHAGFCQVRGTYMQFSCKDGDKTAAFQAMIYQKLSKC